MTKVLTDKLTLLVFENDWCAQCYTEHPIVEKIASEFNDRLKVQFINADHNPDLVKKYQVYSAPTIVLIKNNQVVEKFSRYIDQTQLETVIRYYQ